MKRFLLILVTSLMLLPAFANNNLLETKEKPTADTIFRTDTTTILQGFALIIQLQKEGWNLYNTFLLDEDRVVITSFRLKGSKSTQNNNIPDGIYISNVKTITGRRIKLEFVVKNSEVIGFSQSEDKP